MNRFSLHLCTILSLFLYFSCASKKHIPAPVFLQKHQFDVVRNIPKSSLKAPEVPPRLLVSIERKPCYGKCPAFLLSIYDNGHATYQGIAHTPTIGHYSTKINKEMILKIQEQADSIRYFELQNTYPPYGAIIADVPTTFTYVKFNLEENAIENHHNAPPVLFHFEAMLEELINELTWEKTPINATDSIFQNQKK